MGSRTGDSGSSSAVGHLATDTRLSVRLIGRSAIDESSMAPTIDRQDRAADTAADDLAEQIGPISLRPPPTACRLR